MYYENPYLRQSEANWLAQAFFPYKRIVEIGAQEGRTSKYLLDRLPNCQEFIGIDVLPGYQFTVAGQHTEYPQEPGWRAKEDPRYNIIVRKGGSFDVFFRDLGIVDAFFIDGDHSYDAVRNDTGLAIDCGARLIVWHDYRNPGTPGVTKYIDELRDKFNIQEVPNTWLAYWKDTE